MPPSELFPAGPLSFHPPSVHFLAPTSSFPSFPPSESFHRVAPILSPPPPTLVAIVVVVVVISAHSSDSSCPLARETIYQNAGRRPLSQTIRNRYRSHYHFIAEILGRVMVSRRKRERSCSLFEYVIHLVIRFRISSSLLSFLFLLLFYDSTSKRTSLSLRDLGSLKSITLRRMLIQGISSSSRERFEISNVRSINK